MNLTAEHFEWVARILRELRAEHGETIPFVALVRRFGTECFAVNQRFIRSRFERATGLEHERRHWNLDIAHVGARYLWNYDLTIIEAGVTPDGAIAVRIVDDMTNQEREPVELLLDRQRAEVLIEILRLTMA
jgi:hypothetical protein